VLDGEVRTEDIHPKDALPLGCLEGLKPAHDEDSRAVDEAVQPAPACAHDRGKGRGDGRLIGDVERDWVRVADASHLRHGLRESVEVPVEAPDVVPAGREVERHLRPDPACGPGYDDATAARGRPCSSMHARHDKLRSPAAHPTIVVLLKPRQ
jgi:hypothetical protein